MDLFDYIPQNNENIASDNTDDNKDLFDYIPQNNEVEMQNKLEDDMDLFDYIPKKEEPFTYTERDPEKQQMLIDRGQIGIADKGLYDLQRAEWERKKAEWEANQTNQMMLNDPIARAKYIGEQPILMRSETQQPQIYKDNNGQIQVQRSGVKEQFTDLMQDIPQIQVDNRLLDKSIIDPKQNLQSAMVEKVTSGLYDKGLQQEIDRKAEEERRAKELRGSWGFTGDALAGFSDATKNAIDKANGITSAVVAGLEKLTGDERDYTDIFNAYRKGGMLAKVKDNNLLKFSNQFWNKRAGTNLFDDVVRGLASGVVDVATLKGTSFLKLLNFPMHSVAQKLGTEEIKDLSDLGNAIAKGATEGALMEGALRLGSKILPPVTLRSWSKKLGTFKDLKLPTTQIGTGLGAVAGTELVNNIFNPEHKTSLKDMASNFITMALMAGKGEESNRKIKYSKEAKQKMYHKLGGIYQGGKIEIDKYENLSKKWRKELTPERKAEAEAYVKEMDNLGREISEKIRARGIEPDTIQRYLTDKLIEIHNEKGLKLPMKDIVKMRDVIIEGARNTPFDKKFGKEIELLDKDRYINKDTLVNLPEKGVNYLEAGRVKKHLDNLDFELLDKDRMIEIKKKDPVRFKVEAKNRLSIIRELTNRYNKELNKANRIKDPTERYDRIDAIKQGYEDIGLDIVNMKKMSRISPEKMSVETQKRIIDLTSELVKGNMTGTEQGGIISVNPKLMDKMTVPHEFSHYVESKLRDTPLGEKLKGLYDVAESWTRNQSENFAKDSEKYFSEKELPTAKQEVFDTLFKKKEGLQDILKTPYVKKNIKQKIKTDVEVVERQPDTIEKKQIREKKQREKLEKQKNNPKKVENKPKKEINVDAIDYSKPLDVMFQIKEPKITYKKRETIETWNKKYGTDYASETYKTTPEYGKLKEEQANKIIDKLGDEKASDMLRTKHQFGAVDVEIAKQLVNKYQKAGEIEKARKVLKVLASDRTNVARSLQASSNRGEKFKPDNIAESLYQLENLSLKDWKNPEKFKAKLEKNILKTIRSEFSTEKAYKEYIKTHKTDTILNDKFYDKIRTEAEKIDKMPTETKVQIEKNRKAELDLLRQIHKVLPISFGKKAIAFQTMAQLLNIKTLARNLIGNSAFFQVETQTTNTLGRLLDTLVNPITGLKSTIKTKREKGKGIYGTENREDLKWKGLTIKKYKGKHMGENTYRQLYDKEDVLYKYFKEIITPETELEIKEKGSSIERLQNRRNLSADYTWDELGDTRTERFLGQAEILLKRALLAPDNRMVVKRYEQSLKQQLNAYNKTVGKEYAISKPTTDMGKYAFFDALHGTFQDNNAISDMATTLKKGFNKAGIPLGEFVLKYPKTPANLLHRIYEYSPLSAGAEILKTAYKLKDLKSIRKANIEAIEKIKKEGNIPENQKRLIDSIQKQRVGVQKLTRGLSGTALAMIGRGLLKNGIINPGDSENKKEKAIQQALGIRPYSINIGGKTFSIDWLQPIADPILLGADLSNNNKDWGEMFTSYLDYAGKSMQNQGVVKGVKNLFGKDLKKGFLQVMASAPASFIPTLFSQARYAIDPHLRRVYKKDEEGLERFGSTLSRMILNKIPGASFTLDPRTDFKGNISDTRTIKNGFGSFLNFFEAFISPSIGTEIRKDKNLQWLADFNKANDTSRGLPADRRYINKFKLNGKTYRMNEADRDKFTKQFWELSDKDLNVLRKSKSFARLPYNKKILTISRIYSKHTKELRNRWLKGKL